MGLVKVLARDWRPRVKDDAGDFIKIDGIEELGFNDSKTTKDSGDIYSDGDEEHVVVARGFELTLDGKKLEDPETGEEDDGQKLVEDLAQAKGHDAKREFEVESPGGNVKTFMASASMDGPPSGSKDDLTGWSATLEITGGIQ